MSSRGQSKLTAFVSFSYLELKKNVFIVFSLSKVLIFSLMFPSKKQFVCLSGFNVIYLPFADDFRTLDPPRCPYASQMQVNKMKEIISKLRFKYRCVQRNPQVSLCSGSMMSRIWRLHIHVSLQERRLREPGHSEALQEPGGLGSGHGGSRGNRGPHQ